MIAGNAVNFIAATLGVGALISCHNCHAADVLRWSDATAAIAQLRPKAVACAEVVIQYGSKTEIERGRLQYADAKASIDAAISGLEVAISQDNAPDNLNHLQEYMRTGSQELVAFCQGSDTLLKRRSGAKSIFPDIAKSVIEPLITAASNGIAALYNDHRKDQEQVRETVKAQLEGSRWPSFSDIHP